MRRCLRALARTRDPLAPSKAARATSKDKPDELNGTDCAHLPLPAGLPLGGPLETCRACWRRLARCSGSASARTSRISRPLLRADFRQRARPNGIRAPTRVCAPAVLPAAGWPSVRAGGRASERASEPTFGLSKTVCLCGRALQLAWPKQPRRRAANRKEIQLTLGRRRRLAVAGGGDSRKLDGGGLTICDAAFARATTASRNWTAVPPRRSIRLRHGRSQLASWPTGEPLRGQRACRLLKSAAAAVGGPSACQRLRSFARPAALLIIIFIIIRVEVSNHFTR